MLTIALIGFVSFILGALLGKILAAKGITANHTFEDSQGWGIRSFIAFGIIIFILILLDGLNLIHFLPKIIPVPILLYLGGYIDKIILSLGFFILGLLVFIEIFQKKSKQKFLQLFSSITIITLALSILIYYILPIEITGINILHEVVIQTTPYTCAPSSIATLGRYVRKHPNLLEKDVVNFTHTNKFGTSTLDEIRAMNILGLKPEFHYHLTIEDLIKTDRTALLHVREKTGSKRFAHAVALLEINLEKQILFVGNPLYGIQRKTFAEMEEYWFGEAVFVKLPQHLISSKSKFFQ